MVCFSMDCGSVLNPYNFIHLMKLLKLGPQTIQRERYIHKDEFRPFKINLGKTLAHSHWLQGISGFFNLNDSVNQGGMNWGFSLQMYYLALNIKMKLTVLPSTGKMWKCEKCVTSDKELKTFQDSSRLWCYSNFYTDKHLKPHML